MTEEIKEKLEKYISKYKSNEESIIKGSLLEKPLMIGYQEANDLLNYITNLQKENENLLYEINGYLKEKEQYKEKINKLEDYKQRNEKAVEYIKQHCDRPGRLLLPKIDFNYNDLLNILEGGDE